METKQLSAVPWLAFISLTLTTCPAPAQFFTDNFSANSINTAYWQVSTPLSGAAVTAGGGNAIIENRGRMVTQSSFAGPIDITGRFMFAGNDSDSLRLVTRTDGASSDSYYAELDHGIAVSINVHNGDSRDLPGNIILVHQDWPNSSPYLGYATFPISVGTYYDFRMTDDGQNLAFYMGNLSIPLITASDATVFGGRVGIYNREGWGNKVLLDSFTVVPEPTSASLLGLLGLCGYRWLRRARG